MIELISWFRAMWSGDQKPPTAPAAVFADEDWSDLGYWDGR